MSTRRSLQTLTARVELCTSCPLAHTRSHVVVASGPRNARICILGEAPGATEDASGRPFDGVSGRLLDTALIDAGTSRDEVYVCNAVKCRPPNNRPPTRAERRACAPFLIEQLNLVNPAIIITLGRSALTALDVEYTSLEEVRGRCMSVSNWSVVPTVHPAYVLRRRSQYRRFVHDLAVAVTMAQRGERPLP